ncbi:unnamed protein product, partial [Closterium sp. Naga37s-1]
TLADWSEEELEHLQLGPAAAEVRAYAAEMAAMEAAVAAAVPRAGRERARWALRVVTSRSFSISNAADPAGAAGAVESRGATTESLLREGGGGDGGGGGGGGSAELLPSAFQVGSSFAILCPLVLCWSLWLTWPITPATPPPADSHAAMQPSHTLSQTPCSSIHALCASFHKRFLPGALLSPHPGCSSQPRQVLVPLVHMANRACSACQCLPLTHNCAAVSHSVSLMPYLPPPHPQVLVPLVDMANHACSTATESHAAVQPSATWRIRRGRTQGPASALLPPRFEVLASRPLRPGAQATISYNPFSKLSTVTFLACPTSPPHPHRPLRALSYSHLAPSVPAPSDHLGSSSAPGPPRFELLASRPLRPGAQVTISYGPLTSLAFLLSFGFLPRSKPANRITIYSHSEQMMDDVEERVTRLQHKRHLLSQMTPEDAPLLAYTEDAPLLAYTGEALVSARLYCYGLCSPLLLWSLLAFTAMPLAAPRLHSPPLVLACSLFSPSSTPHLTTWSASPSTHSGDLAVRLMECGIATRLMECLLVLHASSAEELAHLDHQWTASRSLAAANVSPRTRSIAAKQLVDRCRELLNDYPTTLQADEAQLEQLKGAVVNDEQREGRGSAGSEGSGHEKEGKTRRRMQAAVEYRVEEKRILADAVARYGRMVLV